ncbi:putative methyltransferase [Vairimorpha necatrix]|uniref:Methyltransferase n=1 Tax=Vairimorpha necatrix TaxID=6039 RepID=A0AAX4J9U9_9MICR
MKTIKFLLINLICIKGAYNLENYEDIPYVDMDRRLENYMATNSSKNILKNNLGTNCIPQQACVSPTQVMKPITQPVVQPAVQPTYAPQPIQTQPTYAPQPIQTQPVVQPSFAPQQTNCLTPQSCNVPIRQNEKYTCNPQKINPPTQSCRPENWQVSRQDMCQNERSILNNQRNTCQNTNYNDYYNDSNYDSDYYDYDDDRRGNINNNINNILKDAVLIVRPGSELHRNLQKALRSSTTVKVVRSNKRSRLTSSDEEENTQNIFQDSKIPKKKRRDVENRLMAGLKEIETIRKELEEEKKKTNLKGNEETKEDKIKNDSSKDDSKKKKTKLKETTLKDNDEDIKEEEDIIE